MRIPWPLAVLIACNSEPEPCTEVGIGVGDCAPELSLPTASGGDWTLSDHEGDVVLVQFAAAWCGVCQSVASPHQELFEDYQSDGFHKVTVLKGDLQFESVDQSEALEWKTYFDLTHPVLVDADRSAWKTWKRTANGVPQQYLVDRKGAIRWRKVGRESEVELREVIEVHLEYRD